VFSLIEDAIEDRLFYGTKNGLQLLQRHPAALILDRMFFAQSFQPSFFLTGILISIKFAIYYQLLFDGAKIQKVFQFGHIFIRITISFQPKPTIGLSWKYMASRQTRG